MTNLPHCPVRRVGVPAAILGFALSLVAITAGSPLASSSSVTEKLTRQIDVMSSIVDKVLLDSPNFLVHGGTNVTGFYLPDYGAVFAFEASLTDQYFDGSTFFRWPTGFEVRKEGGDDTIVIKRKHSSRRDEGKRDDEEEKAKDPARLYDLGKEELVQALLDYAGTLSAMPSGESVALIANIKNDRLWKERKQQHLQIRVESDDLKAYADDRLSERDLRSRIRVEEY